MSIKGPRKPRSLALQVGGASAVEFAILLPALILVFFALIQFSRMCFDVYTLQYAVDFACRSIILDGSATLPTLTARVNEKLSIIGNPTVTVTLSTETSGSAPIGRLTATMQRSYQIPLLPAYTKTIVADAYMPLAG